MRISLFLNNYRKTLWALLWLLPGLLLPAAVTAQPAADARALPTLAPLVNQVTPAVVNISVITRAPMEDNPLFRDPFFRRFFNLPDRPQRKEQAAGSGVIIDAEGQGGDARVQVNFGKGGVKWLAVAVAKLQAA